MRGCVKCKLGAGNEVLLLSVRQGCETVSCEEVVPKVVVTHRTMRMVQWKRVEGFLMIVPRAIKIGLIVKKVEPSAQGAGEVIEMSKVAGVTWWTKFERFMMKSNSKVKIFFSSCAIEL